MTPKIVKIAAAMAKRLPMLKSFSGRCTPGTVGVSPVLVMDYLGCYAWPEQSAAWDKPFSVLVGADILASMAKEKSLSCAIENGKATIAGASGMSWTIAEQGGWTGSSVERSGPIISIGAKDLHSLLLAAQIAACTDAGRMVLQGVYVQCEGGKLRFVTTDGRRLRIQDSDISCPADWPGAIVPYKDCKAVYAAMAGTGANLSIRAAGTVLAIAAPGFALELPIVEGTYPNYWQVVPKSYRHKFAAAAMVDAAAKCYRVTKSTDAIHFDGLRAWQEGGTGRWEIACPIPELVPIVAAQGDNKTLAFNPKFLAAAAPCDTVELVDFFSPAKFSDAGGLVYVLMPLRS